MQPAMQKHNPVLFPIHKFEDIIGAASPENLSLGFPTRSDTNRDKQPRKMARCWNFRIKKVEVLHFLCSEKKGVVITHLICIFLFAYAKIRFSHDADQSYNSFDVNDMSLVMRKPAFRICENKAADQLITAYQHKLISAFVFATRIVQSFYFLYSKF